MPDGESPFPRSCGYTAVAGPAKAAPWGNAQRLVRHDYAVADSCNLDIKKPSAEQDLEHLPPEQLVESILEKEQRIATIMAEIRELLRSAP